jgi:hypothetical protein
VLRLYLGDVQFADTVAAGNLTPAQTAALLYRSGHKRAAKELLCEQREIYNAFKRTATPCLTRADWELKDTMGGMRARVSALTAFQPGAYRSRADCLTAAYTAGVPLSTCDGR